MHIDIKYRKNSILDGRETFHNFRKSAVLCQKVHEKKDSGVLWHFQFQEFLKFQELSHPCSKQGHGVCCLDLAFRTIKIKGKVF